MKALINEYKGITATGGYPPYPPSTFAVSIAQDFIRRRYSVRTSA